jgi:multiple antibiotic resistance protein
MSLLTLTAVLFLIMDPLGNIKSVLRCLEGVDPKRQNRIIWRELFIALGVILLFNFVGEIIFSVLQISDITVYLASGIILFLGSIKILFPSKDDGGIQVPQGEPFLVPLAIPLIAGPALLATVMLYAETVDSISTMLLAIILSWSLTALIHLYSRQLLRLLGTSGLIACEKLMGMVLVLLSVQRFLEGVLLIVKQ